MPESKLVSYTVEDEKSLPASSQMAGEWKTQTINGRCMSRLGLNRGSRGGREFERKVVNSTVGNNWATLLAKNKIPSGINQKYKLEFANPQKATGNAEKHRSSVLLHFLQPDNPQKRLCLQKVPD